MVLTKENSSLILEIKDLVKDFGGMRVINHLNLSINHGELRCIIGPNGAGKSTLFNMITGIFRPNFGQIIFDGKDITRISAREIALQGVSRKYQVPNVFGRMTVADNLRVVFNAKQGNLPLLFSKDSHEEKLQEMLEMVRLDKHRNVLAVELSHGERQLLEIGMVLASKPRLLLLDEPTAGMTIEETFEMAKLIKRITKNLTTIVIEHDISFVREISQKITVLHKGAVLSEGTLGEIENDKTVREVYLGAQ